MKILFLANHFNTLYAFRKELISRLCTEGYEVYLSLPASDDNKTFTDMGGIVIDTPMDRRGINPIKDLKLIRFYKKILREINPDIVFSYTIKPNIYGCLATNGTKYRQICNITGTGATFLKETLVAKVCRFLYSISIKKAYKIFFQNTGDMEYFIQHGLVKNNYEKLPGSGCNLVEHQPKPFPGTKELLFITIARVMKLKGIDEYLECARVIKGKYPNTRFLIAGWNEEEEYKKKVAEAQEAGYIEYIGFRKDINDWIEKCHCSVLCSHGGEGVPNVMLESAATGRICIGSNINGTKDVIDDGVTGFIFEKGNAKDLIIKVETFINMTDEEKLVMAKAARLKMEREFDREFVIKKYMDEIKEVSA